MDVPTVPALNRGPAFWATLRFPSVSMERSQHLPLRYPYPPPDVLWLSSQGVRYSQVPSSCHHYATLTGSGDTPWWLRYCQLWAEAFEPKLSSLSPNEGNNWVRKELGRAGTYESLSENTNVQKRYLELFTTRFNFSHFFPKNVKSVFPPFPLL